MKKIYLAAPFFNRAQLAEVKRLEQCLHRNATVASVFSPRLGHVQAPLNTPSWSRQIFKLDTTRLVQSDVVLAVIDFVGHHVDSGTAFEIGYANAKSKPVVLFNRLENEPVNLMLSNGAAAYLTKYASIASYNFDDLKPIRYHGKQL